MVAVPAPVPETIPVTGSIIAVVVLLLDQTPPAIISLREIVSPAHSSARPDIKTGDESTLTIAVARHPDATW